MNSPANLHANSSISLEKLAKGRLRETLLDILYRHPDGLNCHQLAEKTGWQMNTVTSQLSKAKEDGLVDSLADEYWEPTKRTIAIWTLCQNKAPQEGVTVQTAPKPMSKANAFAILKNCYVERDILGIRIDSITEDDADIGSALITLGVKNGKQ